MNYVYEYGLRFNPSKTTCFTYGSPSLINFSPFAINGALLTTKENLLYLGADLKGDGGAAHAESRVQASQKAYYGLQGAGLHFQGVAPKVAAHMYAVGVRTILTYGCEAVNMASKNVQKLQTLQGKLLKSFLGLRKFSRTTPLEKALGIPSIQHSIKLSSIHLLRSCLLFYSNATSFYSFLIYHCHTSSTLVNRALFTIRSWNVDFIKILFCDKSYNAFKKANKGHDYTADDGLNDSIDAILSNYNLNGARDILQLLVNAF